MIKVAMVVMSSYPYDTRVRREAEAHIEAGNQVDVLCYTSHRESAVEVVNGIKVYRLKLKRRRENKRAFIWDYLRFFLWAFSKLTFLYSLKRYDVIHIHNMPDLLVFNSLVPKLCGAKVILDLHDPFPELFATIFSLNDDVVFVRVLKWLERKSIRFADRIITPNISFRNLFISRGCPPEKISIVMNSPDERIFKPEVNNERKKNNGNFVIMFHGSIAKRQGPDILMEAVSIVRDKIENLKVLVYGEGEFLSVVKGRIKELDLSSIVELKGSVMLDKIAEAIREIDLGVIPNRLSLFTKINFPVRIFEYLVKNKPVIVPETQGIMDYFSEDSIFFFKAGDSEDLAATILKVYENPANTKSILNKSIQVFNDYRWENQKQY